MVGIIVAIVESGKAAGMERFRFRQKRKTPATGLGNIKLLPRSRQERPRFFSAGAL